MAYTIDIALYRAITEVAMGDGHPLLATCAVEPDQVRTEVDGYIEAVAWAEQMTATGSWLVLVEVLIEGLPAYVEQGLCVQSMWHRADGRWAAGQYIWPSETWPKQRRTTLPPGKD